MQVGAAAHDPEDPQGLPGPGRGSPGQDELQWTPRQRGGSHGRGGEWVKAGASENTQVFPRAPQDIPAFWLGWSRMREGA